MGFGLLYGIETPQRPVSEVLKTAHLSKIHVPWSILERSLPSIYQFEDKLLDMKSLFAALLFFVCSSAVLGYTLPADKRDSEQYHVSDSKGAVASESAVCSRIGVDLIKEGGNAADAVSPRFLLGV